MPHILRRIVVLALTMCAFLAAAAQLAAASMDIPHARVSKSSHSRTVRRAYERVYLASYVKLVRRHGVHTAGCNLVTNKYKNHCKGKATKPAVLRSIATIKRMLYVPPTPVNVSAVTSGQPASSPPANTASAGSGGTYCGLFQFDEGTWKSAGGSGSPCAASPAEQWQRARQLQQQRGNQPWPKCGANGASLEAIMRCESSGDAAAVGG
jgi:hypothetical protein